MTLRCTRCDATTSADRPARGWTVAKKAHGMLVRCPDHPIATPEKCILGRAAVREILAERPGISSTRLARRLAQRGIVVSSETARRWRNACGFSGARKR